MARRTKRLAQLVSFSVHGDVAYGRMNGIFLNASISDMDGSCMIRAFVKREGGVDVSAADVFIAQRRDKYKTAKASYDGQSLNVVIPNYLKLTIKIVADFLSDFSLFLSREGYRSACAFCDTGEALGYTAQEDKVMEVCPACHEKLAGILTGMKAEREESGSYLRGAVGAILGGIVGIIPWVLIGLLGYVAALSGLIMSFLSYKGYLLFKGKRGRGMLFILIAVLIVFTYIAVIVNFCIDLNNYVNEQGYSIDAFELFKIVFVGPFDPVNFDTGAMWAQIGMGWLFAALGSFFFLRNIRRVGKGKDLEIKRLDNNIR